MVNSKLDQTRYATGHGPLSEFRTVFWKAETTL
ncbi:hypothetical protein Avbf_15329 [Armadillidium vulgare]|nr:hypothetical protein Avbf_15329 [Armadillidium vulgare]